MMMKTRIQEVGTIQLTKNLPPHLASAGRPKVLVVDNEKNQQLALAEYLERTGFEPVLANNGVEGLKSFRANPSIKAVITDQQMDGLSGIEMAKAIKEERPDTGILMVTASRKWFEKLQGNLALDVLIEKPVRFRQQILPHIQKWTKLTN